MRFLPVTSIALVLLGSVHPLDAQSEGCWAHWETLGGPYQDLHRSREVTQSAGGHPAAVWRAGRSLLRGCDAGGGDSANARTRTQSGHKLVILSPAALMQYNSDYPRPQQDGLRWAGRGMSAAATAGVGARWRFISVMLAPVMTYQENEPFEIEPVPTEGLSPYGSYHYAGSIDFPQRFGEDPFWWFNLGQSFVRVDAFGAAAGLSTENLRWGPARRNPLLMSVAGPGFPHAFIGTRDPVDIGLGRLEV